MRMSTQVNLDIHPEGSAGHALFVHGLISDHNTWEQAREHLHQLGWSTSALDLSGHGRSGRQPSYSFPMWVSETVHAIDQLDEVPDLIVGHSLGGLIAVGASLSCPVDKMVLIDPLLHAPGKIKTWVSKQVVENLAARDRRSFERRHPTWDPEQVRTAMNAIDAWDARSVEALEGPRGESIVARFLAARPAGRIWIIKPEKSRLLPKRVTRQLEKLGITVIEVPGSGHSPHLDAAENFHQILGRIIAA